MNTENMTEFCLVIGEDTYPMLIEDGEVENLRVAYQRALVNDCRVFPLSAFDRSGKPLHVIVPIKMLRKSILFINVRPE